MSAGNDIAAAAFMEVDEMMRRYGSGDWHRFRWRCGRYAFDALVVASAGRGGNHDLDDIPELRSIVEQQDRDRDERLTAGREAWGKVGTTLLGYPLLCDGDYDGLRLELNDLDTEETLTA
jgi:hypothetical protein